MRTFKKGSMQEVATYGYFGSTFLLGLSIIRSLGSSQLHLDFQSYASVEAMKGNVEIIYFLTSLGEQFN